MTRLNIGKIWVGLGSRGEMLAFQRCINGSYRPGTENQLEGLYLGNRSNRWSANVFELELRSEKKPLPN
jgi:hypothetical protein